MNGKKLACIILLMLVASVVYGTQIMTQRAKARAEEAETAETEKTTAETDYTVANNTYTQLKDDTQELHQFLDTWTPIISRFQSQQDAQVTVEGAIRNSGILTISQKFDLKSSTTNRLMPKIFQGSIKVQDEYSKTLNWLGELETKIPLMRLTTCQLKQGETGRQVTLEIHLEIPIIDLNANMDDKK